MPWFIRATLAACMNSPRCWPRPPGCGRSLTSLRSLAERCADGLRCLKRDRHRKRAEVKVVYKLLSLICSKVAGNHCLTTIDLALNHRSREYLTVEDNRERLTHILLSNLSEEVCALACELKTDSRSVGACIELHDCMLQIATGEICRVEDLIESDIRIC